VTLGFASGWLRYAEVLEALMLPESTDTECASSLRVLARTKAPPETRAWLDDWERRLLRS